MTFVHSIPSFTSFLDDLESHEVKVSHAALFLQGSTNIFVRKVKTLDDILMKSSIAEEGADGEGRPRKGKTIEGVNDEVDTPNLDPDEPHGEITTFPKVPFCLLSSLELQFGIIFLDPSE
jgi:hypothetical protein